MQRAQRCCRAMEHLSYTCISPISPMSNPQHTIYWSKCFSRGLFLCSSYKKISIYKTNQTDSWKQNSGVSCDQISSSAYHQIARAATQRFHTDHICSTYDPAAMPYSTVRQPETAGLCSDALLYRKIRNTRLHKIYSHIRNVFLLK